MKISNLDKDLIIKVCNDSQTMGAAAAKLGIHLATLKKYALKYECYKPNSGAKGIKKVSKNDLLYEILDGKHPSFQTNHLKQKLFKEGILTNQCKICGIQDWLGQTLICELDHIDGDRTNHRLENLRILCPNCHSQTSTFRAKKRV